MNRAKGLLKESSKHKEVFDMFKPDMYTITIKESKAWSPAEFHTLFDGHGQVIQPLPNNKPKAVVTILRFNTYEEVRQLFQYLGNGAEINEYGYEVQLWRKKRFGGVYQYDTAESRICELDVHYNKSRQTLQLVFTLVYGGLFEPAESSAMCASELSDFD